MNNRVNEPVDAARVRDERHTRTLTEVRRALEDLSNECVLELKASTGEEATLLRDVVRAAQQARERVLDVSIAMTRYLTHCLEQTEEARP